MELQELSLKVNELWFSYKFDQLLTYIQLPIEILGYIALYKINQVLKIYIKENIKFLK